MAVQVAVVSKGPAFTWAWQDTGLLMGGPEGQWWEESSGGGWLWEPLGTVPQEQPGCAVLGPTSSSVPRGWSQPGAASVQSRSSPCAGHWGLRVSPVPRLHQSPCPVSLPTQAGRPVLQQQVWCIRPHPGAHTGAKLPAHRAEPAVTHPVPHPTVRARPLGSPPPPAFGQPCAGRRCCPLGHCVPRLRRPLGDVPGFQVTTAPG